MKKKYLFVSWFLMFAIMLCANTNLENQLEKGIFNIKEWNPAFIKEENPSTFPPWDRHL